MMQRKSWFMGLILGGLTASFLLSPAPALESPAACSPRAHGAKGDGTTKDTVAIQAAIDACTLRGGGTVRLTAGTYLSAPLVLKSNITLQLDKGVTLLGSPDHADYPAITEFREPGLQALVSALNAVNVSIVGDGVIDGTGESWWAMARTVKNAGKTVVVNNRNAGENGGTLHSATVNVTADIFFAENITFQNDFNATHPQLYAGSQALALLVTGDRAVFHNARLLGNQDTVYAGSRNCMPDGENCMPARQYFSDCTVAGNVDFIFGDGKAVFDRCEIHSTAHAGGYVTAQAKHYPEEDSGFVFNRCKLVADEGVSGTVYLGRPWRPYATVVYLDTEMGSHIDPAGWREWHPGETHSMETAFYAEYNSTGLGAQRGQRDPHTHFLTEEQARPFEPQVFLRGSDNWGPTQSCTSANCLKK